MSFGKISIELNVPKSTLVLWSHTRYRDLESAREAIEDPNGFTFTEADILYDSRK